MLVFSAALRARLPRQSAKNTIAEFALFRYLHNIAPVPRHNLPSFRSDGPSCTPVCRRLSKQGPAPVTIPPPTFIGPKHLPSVPLLEPTARRKTNACVVAQARRLSISPQHPEPFSRKYFRQLGQAPTPNNLVSPFAKHVLHFLLKPFLDSFSSPPPRRLYTQGHSQRFA